MMGNEYDHRKTRRSSRSTPRDLQAQSSREDHRDASRSRRPQLQSPAHVAHTSHLVHDSKSLHAYASIGSDIRTHKDIARKPQPSPIPSKPTPINQALHSVANSDALEHSSFSDGDVPPPTQGSSHRKGQKPPTTCGVEDRKARRASHTEVRTSSAQKTRDGVGLGLSLRQSPKPNSGMQRDENSISLACPKESPNARSRPELNEDPFVFDSVSRGTSVANVKPDSFPPGGPTTSPGDNPSPRLRFKDSTIGGNVPTDSTSQAQVPKPPRRIPVPHTNAHALRPVHESMTKKNAKSVVAPHKPSQSPRIVLRLHEPDPGLTSARSIQRLAQAKSSCETATAATRKAQGPTEQSRELQVQPSPSLAPFSSAPSTPSFFVNEERVRSKRTTSASENSSATSAQTKDSLVQPTTLHSQPESSPPAEQKISRHIHSGDSCILGDTQPRPRRVRSASRLIDIVPQPSFTKSVNSYSPAQDASSAPSHKNSQEQRMDALMSGLGIVQADGSVAHPASHTKEYNQGRKTPTLDHAPYDHEHKRRSTSLSADNKQDHSSQVPRRSTSPFSTSGGLVTPRRTKSSRSRSHSVQDPPSPEEPQMRTILATSDDDDDDDDDSTLYTPADSFFDDDDPFSCSRQLDSSRHNSSYSNSHEFAPLPEGTKPVKMADGHLGDDVSPRKTADRDSWRSMGTDSQLSTGAEALFRTLQSSTQAHRLRTPSNDSDSQENVEGASTPCIEEGNAQGAQYLDSETDDDASVLDADTAYNMKTWRSTLAPAAFDALLERYGAQEMQRQELIWEICESEQSFVRKLRSILRVFVQPLRTQDRQWISGIPATVMRLFDWLDDILQLHSQIFSALHAARSKQYPVVVQVAEILRSFVPRLELHQPYLARLELVSRVIDAHFNNDKSDFGQYVRIQMCLPEWTGETLTNSLRRAVTQVTGYPLQFRKLWQLTPQSHLDHLPTFSLYHSTDMIVRVMLEVCFREGEYEIVKDISSRIAGLPHHFVLATRERRLVAQGLLRHVQLSDDELGILEGNGTTAGSDTPEIPLCAPIIHAQFHNSRSWESLSPTGHTIPSSSHAPRIQVSSAEPSSSPSTSFSSESEEDPCRTRTVRRGTSHDSRMHRRRSKDSLVYVFVFTDLILLTHRTEPHGENERDTWRLVEDIGMARVLGVTDQSRKISYEHLLSLDILPMPQQRGGVNIAPKHNAVSSVYLSLSERTALRSISSQLIEQAKQQWLQVLRKCFVFTLRSLSFPCENGADLAHGPTADYEMDTSLSIMSILSSGLPLPKSPSILLDERGRGRPPDAVEEEREERGWWALRFRQVLREVQREDVLLCEDQPRQEDAVRDERRSRAPNTSTFDTRRRSVVATPRPLLLSTTSNSNSLSPAIPTHP